MSRLTPVDLRIEELLSENHRLLAERAALAHALTPVLEEVIRQLAREEIYGLVDSDALRSGD
jgi:hypothetical protein